MLKRYKDLMRSLVADLRHILVGITAPDGTVRRGDLDRELERLGIAPDGTIMPFDVLANPTPGERQAYRVVVTQLETCAKTQRASTRVEIVERAAYTWINRLLALRAMETRGLIEETLRNNPDYEGIPEALFILRQTAPERASGADGGRWAVLDDACAAQATALPGLFALDDPATALRPSTPALIHCMMLVGGSMGGFTLAESDAAFADPDAIGWAYQFYQEEAKAEIYAKLGKGGKVTTRSEIAAATQLFTEPYMVKWLLQNSLGRSYHEIYPDSTLSATWEYYVKPEQLDSSTTFNLASLTLLDPCMGSGHFLREAFDMFVAMYHEQFHTFSATEIADRILSHHLSGIDLDPRAAQLSALTLYLRAWELVRDERRNERKPGPGTYIPPAMNLATTPTSLSKGALQRHLQRHPQDMPLKPLLEGIFAGLEQADILGSLLRPKEYLDHAIAELQRPHTIRMDDNPEDAEFRRTITEMANRDPLGLRQMLLERIAESFKAESGNTDDVSAALFGREAERGVRLLQLLDQHYAVVVTNPPYMGSKNMDTLLKKYVEKYYPSGKRDLYAAFILRCLELCRPNGRVAMVTQQSWMFLRSYSELRAMPEEKLQGIRKSGTFTGLLRETSIEALAHLGEFAFEESAAAGAFAAMFTLANQQPTSDHRMIAFRLVGLKSVGEKVKLLKQARQFQVSRVGYYSPQLDLLSIPEAPLLYWLGPRFFEILQNPNRLRDLADVKEGLTTADNKRFTRCFWEINIFGTVVNGDPISGRWFQYAKGGRYQKWLGLEWLVINWAYNGAAIKDIVAKLPNTTHWSRYVRNEFCYFRRGLTYSLIARGSLAARTLDNAIFDVSGGSIFPTESSVRAGILALTATHVSSYLLRITTQSLTFHAGYVANLPLGTNIQLDLLNSIGESCVAFKRRLVVQDPTERSFESVPVEQSILAQGILHSLEGLNEWIVSETYKLGIEDVSAVLDETGTPAGWYALIAGYDTFPIQSADLDLSPLKQELFDYLKKHNHVQTYGKELTRIKANLRMLYEAGPGAKIIEQEESDETNQHNNEQEEIALGAHIPIPTETFLEELSVKMQIHPISVYWLLEELRAEGARCKPEEQRLLEDRLSVLVLRLLGHRWPKQIEAGEPVPDWADRDGIIPLVAGTGKATLAEQLRARLRAEDGELGAQQTEALLAELMNMSLEEWIRKRFFPRHVSQFKYRPIGWQLVSTPTSNGKKKRGGSQRGPAFECFLYYHACTGDALARIRTQYVEPLIRAERQKMEEAARTEDETTLLTAHERMQELEAFVEKLRFVEERGFACPELDKIIAEEPLDRWSGDGYLPPNSNDELLHQEQAWHVDINDGVRVNIAPLQLTGVLAGDVLKPVDAKKALADRARWRSDERRWVRDGKLPRCGWMDEAVPESPRWTEREPERIAEQIKLEQKRLALAHKHTEEVEL
jgi:hypothetical protein